MGILGSAAVASAQYGTKDTSKKEPTAERSPAAAASDLPPIVDPAAGRVGSMSATAPKPSKAELAKMEAEKAGKPAAAGAKTAPAQLDAQDRTFLMEAAKAGMMEVEMGKMATKQGKSAEVRNIGKTLMADHAKANSELMALAKAKGVKLPGAPKVQKMSDANFDSAFLTHAMKDHEKDIAMYERAAKTSKDPEIKAWARKMVSALKSHLKAVKKAQGSIKAG